MDTETTSQVQPEAGNNDVVVTSARPIEQFTLDDNAAAESELSEENYPTGLKVWTSLAIVYIALFLNGLVSRYALNSEAVD